MSEPLRLSKSVIALTGCSRREAELYIEGGWVTVDGQVVEEPQFKVAGQTVALLPGARPDPVEPVTLLLHKPAGYDSGEGPRPAAQLLQPEALCQDPGVPPVRLLRRHFARLSTAMPLEARASGLLVFTQDWQVTRRLTEDAATLEQEYVVETAGQIAPDGLAQLNRAQKRNGWPLPAVKVSWQNETRLRFAGKSLDAAGIEALCAGVGLQALAIRRLRIGSVAMAGLQPGQWRYLPPFKRF